MVATDSSIAGNGTAGGGGGILGGGDATLDGVTVSGNSGNGGGAGINLLGILIATNSTISGNSDANGCGGLLLLAGTSGVPDELSNVTVTDNTNATGAGGGVCSFGAVNARNSIIAGNHGGAGREPDCSGFVVSKGNNLVGAVVGGSGFCNFQSSTGDQVGSAASPIDPALDPLADNGGPTRTHALAAASPAIDAGDPTGCKDHASNPVRSDQSGEPRPVDGDGDGTPRCDVGAFERGWRCRGRLDDPADAGRQRRLDDRAGLQRLGQRLRRRLRRRHDGHARSRRRAATSSAIRSRSIPPAACCRPSSPSTGARWARGTSSSPSRAERRRRSAARSRSKRRGSPRSGRAWSARPSSSSAGRHGTSS